MKLIKCPKCGEMYSDSYRTCPFCQEDEALKGHSRWPVTTSYFEPGNGDRAPAYVLSYDLYDNGVSRNLTLDYGAFALAGTLKEIKVYQGKGCR